MKIISLCLRRSSLLASLLLFATSLHAQDKRLHTQVRLASSSYGNYFQAADGNPKQDIDGLSARLRLEWDLEEGGTSRVYGTIEGNSWSDVDDPFSLRVGLRNVGRAQRFEVFAQTIQNRPTIDFDEDVGISDVYHLYGAYSHRPTRNWEIGAQADIYRQTFDLTPQNDNDQLRLGASVRYRGFGSNFSPELGYATSERDADSDLQDLEQDELWFKIRSSPTSNLYLTLRYRLRDRDYTVADPTASNFRRNDDRRQWTLSADWTVWRGLVTWNVYYAHEDSDSTRSSRTFDTSLLLVGATLHF